MTYISALLHKAGISSPNLYSSFESAYNIINKEGIRNEYVFRSALANSFLSNYNVDEATMLNEVRAGTCKADSIIISEKLSAFEIKSELDSLARLRNQLSNYEKIFSSITVLCSETHLNAVISEVKDYIGISVLIGDIIEVVREPHDLTPLNDSIYMFEAMQVKESKQVLKELGINIPDLPNSKIFSAMREIFAEIPASDITPAMARVMRKNRSVSHLSHMLEVIPPSLYANALSVKLSKRDSNNIIKIFSYIKKEGRSLLSGPLS